MLINLTTLHCFQDVRIVGIFDGKEKREWEVLRWFPHIWDGNKQFRYLAFDKESAHNICEMFRDIIRDRKQKLSNNIYGRQKISIPYYIFIFGSKEYMQKEEIMNELFYDTPEIGVTSLFLFDDLYSLPHSCKFIVDVDNGPCAYLRNEVNNKIFYTPDERVSDSEFDNFVRKMSCIELVGFAVRQEIPDGITFLQGYGVQTVEQLEIKSRWKKSNTVKSLGAPVGMLEGNQIFDLDIHEKTHGPHGLVAGTTGSGKSELLQTWILSMAVNYHPHDVSFVIIDYKGGGMANLLEPLPHVVGKITNIASNIGRSLISLQSENKRREKIFDKYGVNHIDKYQKLYHSGQAKEILPHLIIVADEFAELKAEEPEFMAGLVNVARVGRSLGIHMVLATQKPSGVVDDQIWSNANFKLCLKVQSVADSREMIKKPDAAYITQAGRAYIQVGNDELYELFQSYWSGAPYFGSRIENEKVGNQVRIVDISGQRIKTIADEKTRYKSEIDELTAIVQYINKVAEQENIKAVQGPWMPELSNEVFAIKDTFENREFNGKEWTGRSEWLKIPVGIFDYPELQSQGIQYINLAEEGHYGIYGAPSTGKTTLLKSIVLSIGMLYSPNDVVLYLLDFGGWGMNAFEKMPHVGSVALDSEEEKFLKLETLIMDEINIRKRLFLENSVNSLLAYRQTVSAELPAIVIIIDNIVAMFELYPDLENLFVTIARDGATYGIYMIYTANSTSGIRYKVLQNIRGAIAFELTDRGDYATLVGRLENRTLPKIVGRAFIKGNPPVEFQSSMYMEGENEMEKVDQLKQLVVQMNHAWSGKRPKPIPIMPKEIRFEDIVLQYKERTSIPAGIKYSDIQYFSFDLSKNYSMMIIGTKNSQRNKILAGIAEMILLKQSKDKVFIIDTIQGNISQLKDRSYKYALNSDKEKVDEIMNEIVEMLNRRKRAQNEQRLEFKENFDEQKFILKYEQICIFITDLKEFVDSISEESRSSMERICRLAQGLGVLVFATGKTEDVIKYNEIETLTRAIIANQKGILLEEAPSACPFYKNTLKFNEKDIQAGEGNAYIFDDGICEKVKVIN